MIRSEYELIADYGEGNLVVQTGEQYSKLKLRLVDEENNPIDASNTVFYFQLKKQKVNLDYFYFHKKTSRYKQIQWKLHYFHTLTIETDYFDEYDLNRFVVTEEEAIVKNKEQDDLEKKHKHFAHIQQLRKQIFDLQNQLFEVESQT